MSAENSPVVVRLYYSLVDGEFVRKVFTRRLSRERTCFKYCQFVSCNIDTTNLRY
jgi:hypothetical protein